jgi:hypothetical protein
VGARESLLSSELKKVDACKRKQVLTPMPSTARSMQKASAPTTV